MFYAGPEAFPDNQIAEALVGKLKESRDHSCATHQQPLVLFCDEDTCQVTICALCIPDDHKQHNIVSLRSKAENKKARILHPKTQKAKDLRERIANQRSKLNEANEKKMQLDVGMELTFRLVHVIYKCICPDKQSVIRMRARRK